MNNNSVKTIPKNNFVNLTLLINYVSIKLNFLELALDFQLMIFSVGDI